MNSPARMGAAGINTCGKPFSSVETSKDHTLIPSFSPPRSHTSHSLFLTPPLFPLQRVVTSKGRDSGRTERERGNLSIPEFALEGSLFFFASIGHHFLDTSLKSSLITLILHFYDLCSSTFSKNIVIKSTLPQNP